MRLQLQHKQLVNVLSSHKYTNISAQWGKKGIILSLSCLPLNMMQDVSSGTYEWKSPGR